MLGFDALGKLALGQAGKQSSEAALIAEIGSYAISGTASAALDSIAVGAGAYAVNGQSSALAGQSAAGAGAYAVIGSVTSFADRMLSTTASYVMVGQGASVGLNMPAPGGAYSLFGPVASELVDLAAVGGSYAVTGGASFTPIVMVASGDSYALTLGDDVLIRTGGEFDQVYGGIGHYKEELERIRQMQRITRPTPRPIVRAGRLWFKPLNQLSPPHERPLAPTPVIDLNAIALRQRMEAQARVDAHAQAARRQAIVKRRRQEAEVLLLAC